MSIKTDDREEKEANTMTMMIIENRYNIVMLYVQLAAAVMVTYFVPRREQVMMMMTIEGRRRHDKVLVQRRSDRSLGRRRRVNLHTHFFAPLSINLLSLANPISGCDE